MTKTNDQILLDAILSEQRAAWGATLRDDRLFELFSAEQLLKDKDLTTADVETGNIGQSLDGQIDSFYLFADGVAIDDVEEVKSARRNVEIDVWVIQSKTTPSFDATTLEKLQTTILNIFDFSRLDDFTTDEYAEALLEKAKLFRSVYRETAASFPKLTIHYCYVTTGSTDRYLSLGGREEFTGSLNKKVASRLYCSVNIVSVRGCQRARRNVPDRAGLHSYAPFAGKPNSCNRGLSSTC